MREEREDAEDNMTPATSMTSTPVIAATPPTPLTHEQQIDSSRKTREQRHSYIGGDCSETEVSPQRKIRVREQRHSYIGGDCAEDEELPAPAVRRMVREERHSYIGGDQCEDAGKTS